MSIITTTLAAAPDRALRIIYWILVADAAVWVIFFIGDIIRRSPAWWWSLLMLAGVSYAAARVSRERRDREATPPPTGWTEDQL